MATFTGTWSWTGAGLRENDDDFFGVGSARDTMNGGGGEDWLSGGGGRDVLNGGTGNDTLVGGTGYDRLTGGSGRDNFQFNRGDSGPSYAGADVITDFNSRDDVVTFNTSMAPAGNHTNYYEEEFFSTGNYEQTYNQALSFAQQDIGGGTRYAFYTDGFDGYLFADLDNNGTVDTGIELRGLDSVSDFSYLDIH